MRQSFEADRCFPESPASRATTPSGGTRQRRLLDIEIKQARLSPSRPAVIWCSQLWRSLLMHPSRSYKLDLTAARFGLVAAERANVHVGASERRRQSRRLARLSLCHSATLRGLEARRLGWTEVDSSWITVFLVDSGLKRQSPATFRSIASAKVQDRRPSSPLHSRDEGCQFHFSRTRSVGLLLGADLGRHPALFGPAKPAVPRQRSRSHLHEVQSAINLGFASSHLPGEARFARFATAVMSTRWALPTCFAIWTTFWSLAAAGGPVLAPTNVTIPTPIVLNMAWSTSQSGTGIMQNFIEAPVQPLTTTAGLNQPMAAIQVVALLSSSHPVAS